MRKEEIWAIPSAQAKAFFQQQPDAQELETGFRFPDCTVTLTALPRSDSLFSPNRTKLCWSGTEEAVQQIYHRFFIRFLSAGG